jgi:hypothetical protein
MNIEAFTLSGMELNIRLRSHSPDFSTIRAAGFTVAFGLSPATLITLSGSSVSLER